MNARVILFLIVGAAALGIGVTLFWPWTRVLSVPQGTALQQSPESKPDDSSERVADSQATGHRHFVPRTPRLGSPVLADELAGVTNKLERLAKLREMFQTLAAGEPVMAMRAARQLTNSNERETALLTLVTQWTHGELRSPQERAYAIEQYGLEAGLGIELARNPDLAVSWANELTDGPGRTAVLAQTAVEMTGSDPASAFALAEQLPDTERRRFFNSVFAGWAAADTRAAIEWANQLGDPAETDAALRAIRTVAPVGIGAELRMDNGYAVINQVLPGSAAESSGTVHSGDRIVGLAQGDGPFVNAQGLSLQDIVQMIRGAPGTVLRLQVQAADAEANAQPRTVSIVRDQINFKK